MTLCFLSLVPLGCSEDDKPESKGDPVLTYDQQKQAAMDLMETTFASMAGSNLTDPSQIGNFDFETVAGKFEDLAQQRPDDRDVRVSLGMSRMLSLYRDPVFRHYMKDLESAASFDLPGSTGPLTLGFLPFNMASVLSQEMLIKTLILVVKQGQENPDEAASVQSHLLTVTLPKIKKAITDFEFAETPVETGEYSYALTGKMMGFPSLGARYLDKTEFLMMDSYLEYLSSNLYLFCTVDFKTSDFSSVDLTSLPVPDPENPDVTPYLFLLTKLKFRADAPENGSQFLNHLEASGADMVASLRYLQSETDNQADDVIRKSPELTDAVLNKLILKGESLLGELKLLIEKYLIILNESLPK